MGLREVLGALGRRWYILFIGLALTAGGAWYVPQVSPPDYTARGLVLLLPPNSGDPAAQFNPFLELGGLDLTSRVLVATYSSTSFKEEIEDLSPTAEVEVGIDESTRGGVVSITAIDVSNRKALDALDYVVASVPERMAALQTEVGVAETAAVRTMTLAVDSEAEADYQTLIRLLVIVIGGGIALTALFALVLDALLVRRSRRGVDRSERRGGDGDSEPDEELLDVPSASEQRPVGARKSSLVGSSQPAIARRAVPGALPAQDRVV